MIAALLFLGSQYAVFSSKAPQVCRFDLPGIYQESTRRSDGMTTLTARVLQSAQSKSAPYFIRDAKVKGFAAKVNPSGSIKLIVEVRYEGRTFRKTIGQFPHTVISEAHMYAIAFIHQVSSCANLKLISKLVLC